MSALAKKVFELFGTLEVDKKEPEDQPAPGGPGQQKPTLTPDTSEEVSLSKRRTISSPSDRKRNELTPWGQYSRLSEEDKRRWEERQKAQARQEASADYRTLYAAMTRAIPEDFHLVDAWLCDQHPALWQCIRALDDELTRLEQEGAPEATYRAKLAELVAVCQQGKDLREGRWGTLLIRSGVLGGELVWVVKDEEQARAVMGEGKAVYYADEIEVLKTKTPVEIWDVHRVKLAFPGCRVMS